MQVDGSGLREFRTFVRYQSQQEALDFLGEVLTDERGVALLHGPPASGKSVIANQFVQQVQPRLSIAVVNGARLNTDEMLSRILEQFGYDLALSSADEMMNMLSVFAVQQTRTHEPPVLILENINDMYPSALGALCKLATVTAGTRYAIRIILVSSRDMSRIIDAPSMASVSRRVIGNFKLGPMTAKEAMRYLYTKLRSGGVDRPDDVMPVDVCEKIHSMSGGWPGDMETMALSIIEQAKSYPIKVEDIFDPNSPASDDVPKIIITSMGKTLQEVPLTEKRALIGRSDLSDIVIKDQFVSNQHALLIRDQNAVVLVDLKSRNGTYVNSRRVQSKVLLHNDIISLGDHRMKMIYAPGHSSIVIDDPELADTAKMQNIADARKARERRIPTLVPLVNKKKP
ncbi:MAG TPA: FHA domain-containing protein [Woeseiaceae bacterium]|nr:FHA domain-containing protein [Woeseiaceae bacterium]